MASPFSARDLKRLQGVHPDLIDILGTTFAEMAANGTPMFVVMGVRTAEQQHKLWLQGRGLPGPIVTYKDGYKRKSNHQPRADGLGGAVDAAFLGPDPFADSHDWLAYGLSVEAQGAIWGGRFLGLVDRPHVELP